MEGAWQAREPWRGLLTASLVLGLALYAFASTTQRPPTSSDSNNKAEADSGPPSQTQDAVRDMDPQTKAYHEGFMREAIAMAEHALKNDETPVGCVFVKDGDIIGRGMNETNRTLNGTRHAEFVAIAGILAKYPIAVLQETDLYVTVEPCVMCASMLRQYGIRAVYFGCWNERFGGTGGVLNIHSDPSVDKPYPVYGGIFREEAIMLLRKFYVQENEKAPEPKQKKTRELKTEILPMDVHQPKSTPPSAAPTPPLVAAAAPKPPAPTAPLVAVPKAPALTRAAV